MDWDRASSLALPRPLRLQASDELAELLRLQLGAALHRERTTQRAPRLEERVVVSICRHDARSCDDYGCTAESERHAASVRPGGKSRAGRVR